MDVVDLLGHAVGLRFRIDEGRPAGRILQTLAPAQLVLASLMALLALLFGEMSQLTGSYAAFWQPGHLGPFYTAGPIAYSGWIVAGFSLLLRRPAVTRWCVVLSIGLSSALVPLGHALGVGRPPMNFLVFLVLLGLPYLFVSQRKALRTALPVWQRVLVLWPFVLALAITAQVIRLAHSRVVAGDGAAIFYRIDLRFVGPWTAWIVAGALVISLGCILGRRRSLGAAVAYVSLPWLAVWVGSHAVPISPVRLFSSSWITATVLGLIALALIAQVAVPRKRSSLPEGG